MNDTANPKYFVRRGTERLGQLAPKGIINLLKDGEAFYEIQVRDANNQPWKPLSQVAGLSEEVAQALMNAANTPEEGYSSLSNWRMAQSEKGPFNYLALVQFLQQNQVTPTDWVSHPRLSKPAQIKDITLFGDANLEALFDYGMLRPLFERRKNVRIDYENRVLLYGENNFYSGSTWSLSSQGLGIVLDGTNAINTGEKMKLHIHKTDHHSAIQVGCRVVSRSEDQMSTRLGVVFEKPVVPLVEYIQEVAP